MTSCRECHLRFALGGLVCIGVEDSRLMLSHGGVAAEDSAGTY